MKTKLCACVVCKQMTFEGDDIVQKPFYEIDGSLNYIELAHRSCLPKWSEFDDWGDEEEMSSADENYYDWLDHLEQMEAIMNAETDPAPEEFPIEPRLAMPMKPANHASEVGYQQTRWGYKGRPGTQKQMARRAYAKAARAMGRDQERRILKEARAVGY